MCLVWWRLHDGRVVVREVMGHVDGARVVTAIDAVAPGSAVREVVNGGGSVVKQQQQQHASSWPVAMFSWWGARLLPLRRPSRLGH